MNTNGQFDIHLVAQHCSCYIANVSYMPSTKVESIYASDSSSSSDSDDTDTGECSFESSYICTNHCTFPYVTQGVAALSLSVPVVIVYQPAMCAMGCLTVQMAATKLGVAVIAANIPATVVFVFHTPGCVMGGMTVVTSVTNFSVIFLRSKAVTAQSLPAPTVCAFLTTVSVMERMTVVATVTKRDVSDSN